METVFKIDDQVFAKVRGFLPWPAKITGVTGKKYNVRYYGTGEVGCLKPENLFYYLKYKHTFKRTSKRRSYNKAILEIERVIKEVGTDGSEDTENPVEAPTNVSISLATYGKRGSSSCKLKKSESLSKEDTVKKDYMADLEDSDLKSYSHREDDTKFEKLVDDSNPDPEEEIQELPLEVEINHDMELQFISVEELECYIAYAKYVRSRKNVFKERPVELREDNPNYALAVKLPDDSYKAVKLHEIWPVDCNNEYDRALYDEKAAKRLLKLRDELEVGIVNFEGEVNIFLENLNFSEDEMQQKIEENALKSKMLKMERSKCEATLNNLNDKIKSCLRIDEAKPKEALMHLKDMEALALDDLMLIKHPHVIKTVECLRNYVGNNEIWNMTGEALEDFQHDATLIRQTAKKIWEKFLSLIKIPEEYGDFMEGFEKIINDFQLQVKYFNVLIPLINSEPFSRKFFMDCVMKGLEKKT